MYKCQHLRAHDVDVLFIRFNPVPSQSGGAKPRRALNASVRRPGGPCDPGRGISPARAGKAAALASRSRVTPDIATAMRRSRPSSSRAPQHPRRCARWRLHGPPSATPAPASPTAAARSATPPSPCPEMPGMPPCPESWCKDKKPACPTEFEHVVGAGASPILSAWLRRLAPCVRQDRLAHESGRLRRRNHQTAQAA